MRIKCAQITKVFITWVPVSSTGMTEIFFKKILFLFTVLNFYLSKYLTFGGLWYKIGAEMRILCMAIWRK